MNDTLIRELLAEHSATKKTLAKAKDREKTLRDMIVSILFPNPKTGTNRISFKQLGLEIKAVIKDYWSVKQEGLDNIMAVNENIQNAFKYKYDLVMKGYKELSDEEKILLADNVTCKPTAPELTYEGELKDSILSSLSTRDGVLYIKGENQGVMIADQTAKYLGFQGSEQLVRFLEEIG